MKNSRVLIVAGTAVALVLIFFITTYNSLVKKDENVKLTWNEMQNVYQRRLDLVPNLVNIVKGQTDFEQTTLQKIAEARSRAAQVNFSGNASAGNFQQQQGLQDTLASATNRLIVSIEKYPSLKGTDAFAGLQTQLEGTERRVKIARKDFNESVADYNKTVRSFPSSMAAGLLGFTAKDGFSAETNSDKAIEIKF